MDALELSGGSAFGLKGPRIWVGLVEPCSLKCAKTRISANDAQIRHPYRKHTEEQEPLRRLKSKAGHKAGPPGALDPGRCPAVQAKPDLGQDLSQIVASSAQEDVHRIALHALQQLLHALLADALAPSGHLARIDGERVLEEFFPAKELPGRGSRPTLEPSARQRCP